VCTLCGNDKSESGEDGEKALRDSLNQVRNKISAFLSEEKVGKTNFKYKIKDRLVQLAVDKIARDDKLAEEREEAKRLRKLKKLGLVTTENKQGGMFPAMRGASGVMMGGVTDKTVPVGRADVSGEMAQTKSLLAAAEKERKRKKKLKLAAEEDPWEMDNKIRRKNILRVTGCMIPAPPLFNAEAEKHGSPFNQDTSSVAEIAADQWFKVELGGIEGERKLFVDPVTLGKIPAGTFDWITDVSIDEDVRLGLVADPNAAAALQSDEDDDDDGEIATGTGGSKAAEAVDAAAAGAQDAVTISTAEAFDAWDLQSGEFGKDNKENRLLVCEAFQEGRCASTTCPRAHPGVRDDAEIFFIRLQGRVKKTQYVKCCPLYSGGGIHCGCREADKCRFYHVYHRPSTAELIRLIYPIQQGQKMKMLPSGAKIDGNLKDNQLSGYGVMTWLNGATYTGEWAYDLREGFGIFRTLQGTEYAGGWLGGRRHGMGVYVNALGEEYVGEWKEGKMHGHGVYTFKGEAPKLGYWHEGTVMKWL